MAYRNIFIANTARLPAKNEQLIVDNGETFSFPIEDIRSVLIEDYRSTLTTALISKFAEAGVTLLVCNEKHIPTAALNPINTYSRQLRQINLQISSTLPFRKRLSQHLPDNGSVRLLVITEKQYESIEIMVGNYKKEDVPVEFEQITFL